jgi:MFS family permease
MKASLPARAALLVLRQLAQRNEPLTGDLLEEFHRGRSTLWLWAQILLGLGLGQFRHRVPVALNLTPIDPIVAEWLMDRTLNRGSKRVNLSGSPVEGIGGLSLMILGFLISTVVPAIWWFLLGGIVAGGALGFAIAYHRRNHPTFYFPRSTFYLT